MKSGDNRAMDDDPWNDDEDSFGEDWYDEDEEGDAPQDGQAAHCPECNAAVYAVADRCASCGYWLTDSDRKKIWPGEERPTWLRMTAVVALVAMLLGLLAGLVL